ncbi:dihydrosphingosine 1-phosphate phosphatase Lcb3p [Monosporozyma unispora]|nr:hypothetical protein C6P44_000175 [Kazachstania unispora]
MEEYVSSTITQTYVKPIIKEKYLLDPGNHESKYFKSHMSPWRFQLRQKLATYIKDQSIYLAQWQVKYRTPLRDKIFVYSALLGSHTFYVLCLPMPAWLGYYNNTKDLVYIIGLSIFISGFFKDFFCLPRPHSPPLERINLSESTAKEYGAPSSHTANAVGVSLYLLRLLYYNNEVTLVNKSLYASVILTYCVTLILGRLYCGMHGLFDIICGIVIGTMCMVGRTFIKEVVGARFQFSDYWWVPIASLTIYLTLLLNHVRPIDECPCFDDSVAFIGVISGLECSDWFIQYFGFQLVYNFSKSNLKTLLLRLIVGVPFLVIWKYIIGKPLVYFIVGKILGIKDDRMGRQLEIKKQKQLHTTECISFCGISKFDIITRFIIYSGIPFTVMLFTPIPISIVEKNLLY